MSDAYNDPSVRLLVCVGYHLLSWDHDNLSTPHWRLYWNRMPGAMVLLHGRQTPLDPMHLVLIPPNTPFSARWQAPVDHLFMHFVTGPMYAGVAPAVFKFAAGPETRTRASALFDKVGWSGVLDASTSASALCLIHQALSQIPADRIVRRLLDPRVAKAARVLESEFSTPPGNAALARAAGLSENAFIRLFTRETGSSPQAYGMSKRIEEACMMLHYTRSSIEEIAEATGFCDRYHFTHVFTRLRRLSPAAFRRQAMMV